jgi:hypothetical protein
MEQDPIQNHTKALISFSECYLYFARQIMYIMKKNILLDESVAFVSSEDPLLWCTTKDHFSTIKNISLTSLDLINKIIFLKKATDVNCRSIDYVKKQYNF